MFARRRTSSVLGVSPVTGQLPRSGMASGDEPPARPRRSMMLHLRRSSSCIAFSACQKAVAAGMFHQGATRLQRIRDCSKLLRHLGRVRVVTL